MERKGRPTAVRGRSSGTLTPMSLLGEGHEGTVWTVRERPDLALKLYHGNGTDSATSAKLKAMIAAPPERTRTSLYSIAWPIETITRPPGRRVIGYLMRRLDEKSFREIGTYMNVERRRRRVAERGRPYAFIHLLAIAQSVATMVADIHARGHVIGDLSSRNVRATDQGRAGLVDADSMQICEPDSGAVHKCSVITPEYAPPELQSGDQLEETRSAETDLFALAVLIYQLLFQGRHPFAGVLVRGEQDTLISGVADRIRKGEMIHTSKTGYVAARQDRLIWSAMPFKRQMRAGTTRTGARYPAARWAKDLEQSAERLKQCEKVPTHQYFGARECTWCRYRDTTGVEPFPLHC